MRPQVITQIVDWLKANGKRELDGKNFNFNCNDDPYMRFAAEWQDWGDNELLLIGYCFVQNGDVCNDPQFAFKIENGELPEVSYDNWTVGPRPCEEEADLEYAFAFAELVFNRHMKIAAATSGLGSGTQPESDHQPVNPEGVVPEDSYWVPAHQVLHRTDEA